MSITFTDATTVFADATHDDALISQTDNGTDPGDLAISQDPSLIFQSDTQTPAEVLA